MRQIDTHATPVRPDVARGGRRVQGILGVLAVPLPDWVSAELVIALTLSGIAAFAAAGFLGYPYSPGWFKRFPFTTSAALYGYGCVLAITLLWLILRHPSPRQEMAGDAERVTPRPRQLSRALAVSFVSIVIVALAFEQPAIAGPLLDQLAGWLHLVRTEQLIANLVNLWFVGVYGIDALARWIGSARKLRTAWTARALREKRLASALGLLANDLITGAALFSILAVLFRSDVLNFIVSVFRIGTPTASTQTITDCVVSLRFRDCGGARIQPNDLPTITFVDANAALWLLGGSLVFLALYALVRVIADGRPMGEVIAQALRQMGNIRRVLGLIVESFVAPARRAMWPFLILVSIFAVAFAAQSATWYLRLLSCEHQWAMYGESLGPVKGCVPTSIPFDTSLLGYAYLGRALAFAGLAAGAIVISAVIQLYDRANPDRSERQVAGYWLPALGRVGASVLIPFGVLSLAMCVFDFALIQLNPGRAAEQIPRSFYPPGLITYVAALAGVVVVVRWVMRRRRRTTTR